LEPDPKLCCETPALVSFQHALGQRCQDLGRARRNDRGPQEGGDPTFISALVNGRLRRFRTFDLAYKIELEILYRRS